MTPMGSSPSPPGPTGPQLAWIERTPFYTSVFPVRDRDQRSARLSTTLSSEVKEEGVYVSGRLSLGGTSWKELTIERFATNSRIILLHYDLICVVENGTNLNPLIADFSEIHNQFGL